MDDRISKFPDDVLCHILSFLPTEQAIATSVLSKWWRSLWSSVPTLNFDAESYLINDKPSSSFHKLVYATILARCANQPIRRFRLKCDTFHYRLDLFRDYDVNIWVNAAVERGIEILEIQMRFPGLVLGPRCSIFSCSTLVDLKLIKVDFSAFSSVHLPSLKILHLDELIRDDIEESYLETSSIPLKAIRNVEFLRIDKYVEYPNDIPLFPNLTHLELVFGRDIYWHGHLKWDYVLAMLKQSPKLQVLVLKMMRCPHDVVWPFPEFFPECLSSQLKKCSVINYWDTECELLFVKYIMQNSRVLRTMSVFSESPDKLKTLKQLCISARGSWTWELLFQ
ncbi:Leucine-rich repeat domain superfamily [Sesbania bispinosa]|nr:Leucine-rich repeat domain superfamily [Sesbania bispinosa]